MTTKLLFLFLQISFVLVSCQDSSTTTEPLNDLSKIYETGDTINIKGTITIKGDNEWQIYADNSTIPLCPIKIEPDSSWKRNAIPDSLKTNGLRIRALAIVMEPPSELRLSCALIQILKIERLK